MITIEQNDFQVNIIMDEEGARKLIKLLDGLLNKLDTHYHLMTPSFGGNELSEKTIIEGETLINMLRLQIC